MKILVLNSGSSSVKYKLYSMNDETVLAEGIAQRIGLEGSFLEHKVFEREKEVKIDEEILVHSEGIQMIIETLIDKNYGALKDLDEITAVGHRVVHGGEYFPGPTLVKNKELERIEELSNLAHLHNPHNAKGIRVLEKLLPDIPQVAVFDTSFHQTMPPIAYIYSLPYKFYTELGIRRYGFHGTSHKYVAWKAAELMGKNVKELKIITLHLGNGASMTAVMHGKSLDTNMGFTPLEGLVMGTRCGDIDPAIITYLQESRGWDPSEIDHVLNKKSGLLGISGLSSDLRDIEAAAAKGNKRAQLAVDIFCYRVKKYIGSYIAAMNGVDVIIFTAGIGENSDVVREKSLEGMDFMGITMDPKKNLIRGKLADISAADSKVKIFVIPTNEELEIARQTLEVLQKKGLVATPA